MYDGSRCCERTSTPTSGCARRIFAAATSPSSALPGGIRTSMTATSGVYERTLSRRSSASPARPTTTWPASSSSDEIPSRSSASSSATTTRKPWRGSSSGSCGGVASALDMGASASGATVEARELQQVEHEVALILAQTEAPVEVYAAMLEAIGRCLGWALGAVWELDPRTRRLHCVRTWRAGGQSTEFEALSEQIEMALGEGLPGRVA